MLIPLPMLRGQYQSGSTDGQYLVCIWSAKDQIGHVRLAC